MAPCSPSLYLVIRSVVFVFLMLSAVPLSNGSPDADYHKCSSTCSCGPIKDVGYPFWEDNIRPAYCGLHEFRLKCTSYSSYPSIALNNNPGPTGHYNVHHIDNSSRTILVARDKYETCQFLQYPTSIDMMAPFKLGANVVKLTLFYGCPNSTFGFRPLSFQCPIFDQNVSIYYFNRTSDGRTCQSRVTLPVSTRALNKLNDDNAKLESALEEEFEIRYTMDFATECSRCRKSGGICGSSFNSAKEFVCHKSKSEKRKVRNVGLILGLGIAGAIMLTAVVTCWFCKRLKTGHSRLVSRNILLEPSPEDLVKDSLYFGVPLFSYRELEEATNKFDGSRELGTGGFGIVFFGKLRDGREVAVKRLYETSYRRVEQFMNEVQILTSLQHQNLVSLYGCTSPNYKELLLVYAYVQNGTVADHLHGSKAKSGSLSWPTRFRIAVETATALAYLHASEIIHRDVKTNNILLDGNFGVKVADFGLSRLFPAEVTHVSTAPQGTPGYLDPEYHQCYQLTVKSDVYSFGVVLIELISSLPAVDMNRQKHEINLSNYAVKRIQQGLFHGLVDPKLGFESDLKAKRMITSVAELAFRCLQHDKEFRPSMDEVLEVLKRIENADYEALEAKEESKSDGMGRSARTPASPTEDDDAGLLFSSSHFQQHPLSPNSVMDRWKSSSAATSSTSRQGSNSGR